MAVRSVPVKRQLIGMVEETCPGFRFVSESGGTYGFVRERPEYWYDYLPINRCFQGGRGSLSINWYLIGSGYVPDWYEWNGIYHTPWRVLAWPAQGQPDPDEPPTPLASPGHDAAVRYQTGTQADLSQALRVLADKLRRYAIPALERPFTPQEARRLQRWHRLAECILPQIEALSLQDPAGLEELKAWQRKTARRQKRDIGEDIPPIMARWREEARLIPGFVEEWDTSPTLHQWVFNWFTHALLVHP